jgi:hypothetical protein
MKAEIDHDVLGVGPQPWIVGDSLKVEVFLGLWLIASPWYSEAWLGYSPGIKINTDAMAS